MLDELKDKTLAQSLEFILKIDGLKKIERKTKIVGSGRQENSAEHSWHLMMMALVLQDCANEKIDLLKVLKMLAIHELGEIDGGDSFFYDETLRAVAEEKEKHAVQKLCENLSSDLQQELMDLWQEFSFENTAESRFAQALDRYQPFLSNLANAGGSWKAMKITKAKALEKNKHIAEGSKKLWDSYQYLADILDDAGYFHREMEN